MRNKLNLFIILVFFLSCKGNSDKITDVRTGVEINFVVDEETIPQDWRSNGTKVKCSSLDEKEIERSLKVIKKAFAKYPKSILSENLKAVHFLNSLEFNDVKFGGTYSRYAVFILNEGKNRGYTDEYLEQTFHHEFSSILLRNCFTFFDEKKWIAYNKVEYGNGGFEALKNSESSLVLDTAFHSKGFLCQYGTSNIEEDFNTFAENSFLGDNRFYSALKEYSGLNAKFKLLVSFYSKLDKIFSEQYFFNMNKDSFKRVK